MVALDRKDSTLGDEQGRPSPSLPTSTDSSSRAVEGDRSSYDRLRLPSRFQVMAELGRGGMGAVYRAYDRTAGHEVALKVLHGFSVDDRLRLKDEFRALSDIVHPNLVALHDLVIDDQACFFTMELVRGTDFASHVRRLQQTCKDQAERQARTVDLARQLATAIDALHQGEKLHRDIKPSNVLVTEAGRVVLLDFGLASATTRAASGPSEKIGGTLLYMSPEQFWGAAPSPASDWYAFGLTLYEALAGELPSRLELMATSNQQSGLSLVARGVAISSELDELIARLLRTEPEARPTAREILSCLGTTGSWEAIQPSVFPVRAPPELIGREALLGELRQAFDHAASGLRTLRLLGPSGVGKSTLMRAFLGALEADPNVVCLTSRCHPQEALVFNALDGLFDMLAHRVGKLLTAEQRRLPPGHHDALTRVFPVLGKALDIENPAPSSRLGDRETRLLALAAVRELLRRVAARYRVVLWLDDVQWGDQDSGVLLREVLRASDRPAMLLVLSYREDDEGRSPCLGVLRDDADLWEATVALPVGPLNEQQSSELVGRLLGPDWHGDQAVRDALIRSAAGSPFFLGELGRYLSTHPEKALAGAAPRGNVGIDEILRVRTRELPPSSRTVLEILAVAGAPLEQQTTLVAAQIDVKERGLLTNLERLSILRTTDVESRRIEFYHDKLREEVLRQLDQAARVRHHRAIAEALVSSAAPNPLMALEHFDASGDVESVRRYVVSAANHALKLLAFERAARLYRRAIDLEPGEVSIHELFRRLGSALGSAGRGHEAALAYSTAADLIRDDLGASREEATQLRQRAAEQFIQSGHFQEGTEVIRAVLAELGVPFPQSRGSALRRAAALRVLSLVRKLRTKPGRTRPSELELRRFDALWGANTRLAMVDYALCSYATIRCAIDASKLGEPSRMSRAIAMEASICSTLPAPTFQRRALELLEAAESLASEAGSNDYDSTFALAARAIISFYRGDYDETWRRADEAIARLHEHAPGWTWEEATWQMWSLIGLSFSGEIRELIRRVRATTAAAELLEDRYLEQNVSLGPPALAWLAVDQPEEGLRRADRALSFSPSTYTVQHYQHYVATVDCDLYRGNALSAWARTVSTWPNHKREHFLMVTFVRDDLLRSRGRAALAAAVEAHGQRLARVPSGHGPEALLKIAKQAAREMSGHGLASAQGFAALLEAGLACVADDKEAALLSLHAAGVMFERARMRLFREVVRYVTGCLVDDETGREERDRAAAWMRDQGILVPERMVATLAPGLLAVT
jgi:tetratricopeptide (TPR) repeat protein